MSDRGAERSVSRVPEPALSRGGRSQRRVRTASVRAVPVRTDSTRTDSAPTDSTSTGAFGAPSPVDAAPGTGPVTSRPR